MSSPHLGAEPDPLTASVRGAVSENYELVRELGRGGAATVFLARDRRHARSVAIKVMAPEAVGVGGAERFLHEIRTAARLTHPHILGVHDSGETAGVLYYVMPYVEGETLRARLVRGGALPLADAVRLIRELADALAYAHERGVVHRDLKPENVLLSGGHAVIADFGIAKAMAAATHGDGQLPGMTATGVALGTPAYMAPEQAVGDRNVDHRADLYALGVVAYEVLAGTHPFGSRSAQAHVAAHLTEAPAPLRDRHPLVPPAVSAIVMQLLAKDPAARPPDAMAVVHALDAAMTSAAPAAARPRRHMRAMIALVAALVVLAGFVAWRQMSSRTVAIRTLAVMPFENIGGDTTDEYFSDGMTGELAHALGQLPGLAIAGRTSTYALKGKTLSAQEIGRTLDVAAMVSGTVRRAGGQLRVTTQLVSTKDGKVLWDSVYQSGSRDVFAVQDEFTRAIAATLARSLGERPAVARGVGAARGTTSEAAYDLFLKGQFFYLARGQANVEQSIVYLRQAIAVDPAFARAHAALARSLNVLQNYVPDPADTLPRLVRASAERAVALDSTLADAQASMARALEEDLRLDLADARYARAIALEPANGDVHLAYGFEQMTSGHTDNAIRELREAVRLDPLVPSARAALSMALMFGRHLPESMVLARQIIAVNPTYPLSYLPLALAQALSGQGDSAVHTLEKSAAYNGHVPGRNRMLLYVYAAAGRRADIERARTELRRQPNDPTAAADAAYADMLLGNREPLVRLLTSERGQRYWINSSQFGCNPLLDQLWSDARFVAAMRAIRVECSR